MKKKLGVGFLLVAGALVLITSGFASNLYPVATVSDGFVSARSFHLAQQAATAYYARRFTLTDSFASTSDAEFESGMRQVALQALIEDWVITEELLKTHNSESLEKLIAGRMTAALDSSTRMNPEAIQALFNITIPEFKEVVLAPEARAELLSEELSQQGIDFDTWLAAALNVADVDIAVADMEWRNGRVELTGEQSYTAKVKGLLDQFASTTEAFRAATASSVASSSVQ